MNITLSPSLLKKRPSMDTSQQIRHVYACNGVTVHVSPGFTLLRAGNIKDCPQCGASLQDITDSPLGQAYFAFTRPDLGPRPA